MRRAIAVVLGLGAAITVTAGCGGYGSGPSSPPPSTTAAPVPTEAASLKTASTPLGTILVDSSGRTLYLFEADTGPTSTCYGACAGAWPPYTTTATPTVGGAVGLNPSMIGTTTRTDHTIQVTYNRHPLYYFAEDAAAGQTSGQGTDAFGGKWFVVGPDGNAITTAASANPSSTMGAGGDGTGGAVDVEGRG